MLYRLSLQEVLVDSSRGRIIYSGSEASWDREEPLMSIEKQREFDQLEAGGRGQSSWRLASEREMGARLPAKLTGGTARGTGRGCCTPQAGNGWLYFYFTSSPIC